MLLGLERQRRRFERNAGNPTLQQLFLEVTPRCNLSCIHCGSRCDEHERTEEVSLADFTRILERVRGAFGTSVLIAITGGEPLLQADFVAEVMRRCREEGIDTALDTCAAVPWSAFEKVLPYTSRVLFDIKHADSETHRRWTGLGNEGIWDNLTRLGEAGILIEIRIPCVPGVNMDEATVRAIGERLAKIPTITGVRPLAYHDFARSKYKSLGLPDTMPRVALPDAAAMDAVRGTLAEYGLTIFQ